MSPDNYAEQLLRTGSVPRQPPWVRRHLAKGRLLQTTLLVGHPHGVAALHQQLLRQPRTDYRVIGCCLPGPGRVGETLNGLPVLGGPDDVVDVVRLHLVDTVAVLLSSGLDGAALSRLERDMEATRAELLLAPAVTGAAGSRVSNRPVGRQSPQRERPGRHGVHGLVKASFDRAAAVLLLVLLAPVLIGVAVWVKVSGRGTVFVREPRVGRGGRLFHVLKFRTTAMDSERRVDHRAAERDGDGRSGIHRDPRESRLGSTLRRYSIDELPALFNVLKGDMSLVGPRPGLPAEITRPGVDVDRQVPVKPGLIGLGQVSGSPGRSRDDRRLVDVHYVEDWSLLLDLKILRATLAAVLRHDRAP